MSDDVLLGARDVAGNAQAQRGRQRGHQLLDERIVAIRGLDEDLRLVVAPMANIPEFKYAPMFQLGEDKTEYYLLSRDGVSVGEFEGHPILKVSPEALTALTRTCFRDVSFMLRRAHNEQVAKILSDPEASDNDKYVALTFLRNAEVSVKGKYP